MPNVKIHVGLFSDTLRDLDQYGDTPVAFAHIDVDIFPSAVEVLSRIACQLWPGSVLVYDELVNYIGFELSGEYRAWEYVASAYGIGQRSISISLSIGWREEGGVEHLVMRSMCAELIRGQIDEVSEMVTVTWVKPRILDPVRIDLMRERMDAWASQTGLLLEHLEQVTPELLVS
ncbi:psmD13 [Symbiodinium pilosum]|uniref:PsmD13 protein n=1 Tax=Symbiodinium pilosum TaxID=2952 RepID=A0A812W6F1_SYMPI|nr:psmD13 [Symbiodinium pilosum]